MRSVIAMINRRRRRGFSLIEIAMVLAIAALLIAGVMLFFTTASSSEKTNESLEELAAIQQVVRSLGAGQSDYSWLTTTPGVTIGTSGQIPSKWYNTSSTTLKNPYGGVVTVAPASSGGGTNNTFTVQMASIPHDGCSKMVTQDMGTSLYSVVVGSGTPVYGTAMSPGVASTTCIQGSNSITWTLY